MRNFKSNWIWTSELYKPNHYVQFVDFFNIEEPSNTKLFISANSDYCVYINGAYTASNQFKDVPEDKIYDEIKISNFVKQGKNTLAILGYCFNKECFTHIVDKPAIIFEVESNESLIARSSNKTLCMEAPDYISGETPIYGNGNLFTLEFDFAKKNDFLNGNITGFSESFVVNKPLKLNKRPIKKLVIEDRIPNTLYSQGVYKNCELDGTTGFKMQNSYMAFRDMGLMTGETARPQFPSQEGHNFKCADGNGIYFVLDLQSESNGYLDIEFELKEDAVLHIGFGEHLDDLKVRTSIGPRNFTASFFAKKGLNKLEDYITRFACRYLQVFVSTSFIKVFYIGLKETHYPVNKYPIKLADNLHQKIYDVSVKTLIENMHEHYEDCPWREQALYAMDSRNQMLCGYYTFKEYDFAKSSLKLLFARVQESGLLNLTAPTELKLTIPSFTFAAILALKEYTEHSLDLSLAKYELKKIQKIIDSFLSLLNENGLLKRVDGDDNWNFYEWSENLVNKWGDHEIGNLTEYPAPLNAFFLIALNSFIEIKKLLKQDFKHYINKKVLLEKSLDAFWNDNKQAYCTYILDGKQEHYCELTNALMLFSGACKGNKAKKVSKILMSETSDLIKISLSMSVYKYDALIKNDIKNISYVISDITKTWGKMVYSGATTFWETILGADDFSFAGSLCHGWSAIPAYFFHKYKDYLV